MPPRRRRMFDRLVEMGLDMQPPRPAQPDELVMARAEAEAFEIIQQQRRNEQAERNARIQRALEAEVLRRAMPRAMHVGRAERFDVGDGVPMFSGAHGNIRRHIVGRTGRNNRPNRKIMLQASKKESDV